MKCPDIQQLDDFASRDERPLGVSAPSDQPPRDDIRDHVRTCPRCAARLKEIRANLSAVSSVAALIRDAGRPSGDVAANDSSNLSDRRPPDSPNSVTIRQPEWIGPYRILRELGRGGMGVVYEAEQDNPRRHVALKVLRSDLTSRGALRRFEHESQFLARLHHPGIAQIYEAATFETPDGPRPYFAMERIAGIPLMQFVREQHLTATQSLTLAAAICDAVHHAHLQGVVHRDLKPANIRVDTAGQIKVLDFGVARLTDGDLRITTLHTDTGQLVGTVPYMSPEQVRGNPADVDARSDVYALGVILYEMLSGRLPYRSDAVPVVDAARAICDDDPTPLGTIERALRGDPETIVAKALEKDKSRRYQSAAELAADIRRHLADEPIAARPPSAMYQLHRFARRHRGFVGGLAIAVTALLIASIASLRWAWQAVRAEGLARQRLVDARAAAARAEDEATEARRQTARFKAVLAFIEDTLASASPWNAPDARRLTVQDALRQAADKLTAGALASQPEVELSVRATIGNTLRSLGDLDAAESHLRRAVELGDRLYPDGHEDLAFALNKWARLRQERADYRHAEALFRRALAMQRRLHTNTHPEVAKLLNNLGWLMFERGRGSEAESMLLEALDIQRRADGDAEGVATTLNNLAAVYSARLDGVNAERLLRESLEIDLRIRGPRHPDVTSTMINLAIVLQDRGCLDEAESLMRRAMALRRELVGPRHPSNAVLLNNLARLVAHRGDAAQAESMYLESALLDCNAAGAPRPSVSTTLANLGRLLQNQRRFGEAGLLYAAEFDINRAALGPEHPRTLAALFHQGMLYSAAGTPDVARPPLEQAVVGARAAGADQRMALGLYLREFGVVLMHLQRFEAAEAAMLEAYGHLATTLGTSHPGTIITVQRLLELYDRTGNRDQARAWRARLPDAASNSDSDS